jgi:hypothetical protein
LYEDRTKGPDATYLKEEVDEEERGKHRMRRRGRK